MDVHGRLSPIALRWRQAEFDRGAKSRDHLFADVLLAFSRPIDQAIGFFSDPRIRHASTLVAWGDDDYLNVLYRTCPVIRPGASRQPEIILSAATFLTVPDSTTMIGKTSRVADRSQDASFPLESNSSAARFDIADMRAAAVDRLCRKPTADHGTSHSEPRAGGPAGPFHEL
ncbi:hypothetical protein [Dongia sp.]|uniref:hypothetical protein n=1 Tax=Dongia sp. TaxID=1977262 RepID=UPI0035B19BF5